MDDPENKVNVESLEEFTMLIIFICFFLKVDPLCENVTTAPSLRF